MADEYVAVATRVPSTNSESVVPLLQTTKWCQVFIGYVRLVALKAVEAPTSKRT